MPASDALAFESIDLQGWKEKDRKCTLVFYSDFSFCKIGNWVRCIPPGGRWGAGGGGRRRESESRQIRLHRLKLIWLWKRIMHLQRASRRSQLAEYPPPSCIEIIDELALIMFLSTFLPTKKERKKSPRFSARTFLLKSANWVRHKAGGGRRWLRGAGRVGPLAPQYRPIPEFPGWDPI